MCLVRDIIKNPLCQATKEITCYKVVMVPRELRGKLKTNLLRFFGKLKHYETYFQETPVTIGTTVYAKPAYTRDRLKFIEDRESHLDVGFIHSFKHKEDAVKFIKARLSLHTTLVKCIIPVGAYYFEGDGGWLYSEEQYASTALKYVKVIKS